ncbi:hypothetical protein [Schaalia sp. Marseille-Q2122]|uniref:hypothetical protein n=1 Tax=Schaalia sp. Marseille-Q2122 TaxID=2736604 RepID=UPI00158A1544|nr:hypothetical protein [Schaalia sp. Marseille-Q2122]
MEKGGSVDYRALWMIIFGAALLVVWWFDMFSDSAFGQMGRSVAKWQRQGRNVIALFLPGFSAGMILLAVVDLLSTLNVPDLVTNGVGFVAVGVLLVAFLGFLPIPLPRWMYPEYHLARRERIRAEKLSRGEVVKMPSSGRVAVEAQRLEQIVREREAAQCADEDSSR